MCSECLIFDVRALRVLLHTDTEEVVSQCMRLPIFCCHHDPHDHHDLHDHHDRHDNLVPSECPGAKLHNAGLLVEREVGHIYRTGRLQEIVLIILFYCYHIIILLVTVITFAFVF